MTPEGFIEFIDRVLARGLHFLQHPGVAADRTLAENDQRARQNIGALHRDRNRNLLVGTAQIIVRAHADTLAAVNVHRIIDHLAHALGGVIFRDRRQHRGFLAQIECTGGDGAGGIHQIGHRADPRQRLFDAFEFADLRLELLAHARVSARGEAGDFAGRDRLRRQRDGAARRQTFHQHAPALTDHFLAADYPVHRDEYILAPIRAVHEGGVEGHMAATDIHAFVAGGNQGTGDAEIGFAAEQFIRVKTFEGETEDSRHRAERDVALLPGDTQAQRFLAFVYFTANNADVRHGSGIRPGLRRGQRKARYLQTLGQSRQVVILLRFGAVVHQQFAGTQGIRHHHRHGRCRRAS